MINLLLSNASFHHDTPIINRDVKCDQYVFMRNVNIVPQHSLNILNNKFLKIYVFNILKIKIFHFYKYNCLI